MHIYEGGDFSTTQEHLEQTHTKSDYISDYITTAVGCARLLPEPNALSALGLDRK